MDRDTEAGHEINAEDTVGVADLPLLNTPDMSSISSGNINVELCSTEHRSPSFTVLEFETLYRKPEKTKAWTAAAVEAVVRKFKKFSWKKQLRSNFPTLSEMRGYRLGQDLPNDLVAGLTVGTIMIPQGLAFAFLSTLPPIVGLYMCFFASLAYFFIGTCHQLSWGCVAVLSILIGNIMEDYDAKTTADIPQIRLNNSHDIETPSFPVNSLSANSTSTIYASETSSSYNSTLHYALSDEGRIEVACAVTLLSGLILATLGKLGLGRLAAFMSDSLVTSFTVGASFHVVTSQAKIALGLDSAELVPNHRGIFKFVFTWYSLICNMHMANPATISISVICITALYLVKRFVNEKFKSRLRVPVPIELFVIIIATVICALAGLNQKYAVNIVNKIPVGLPKPKFPNLLLGFDYFTDGLVIIFLSFTQNVAMAKLMAVKHNYHINANQEMFACGAVSVVCSVFSGYVAAPSVSRSIVQDGAGGKTQVASLFAAGLVLLVIMVVGPYFYYLPKCVLAVIIIINLRSMFLKLLTLPDLWQKSHVDCLVWIITCLATVFLETDIGLLIGLILSVLFVLIRSQLASVDVVKEIAADEHVSVWRSKNNYIAGKTVQGMKVVRINSAIYFANAEIVTEQVFKKTGFDPVKLARSKKVDVLNQEEIIYVTAASDNNAQSNTNSAEYSTDGAENNVRHSCLTKADEKLIKLVSSHFSVLIIDMSCVPFLDLMGVQALEFLFTKYKIVQTDVYFVGLQEKCLDILHNNGFLTKHKENIFVSMNAALKQLKL